MELVYTGSNLTLMSSETFRGFSAHFVCRWAVVALKALGCIAVRILEQCRGCRIYIKFETCEVKCDLKVKSSLRLIRRDVMKAYGRSVGTFSMRSCYPYYIFAMRHVWSLHKYIPVS